MGPPVLVRPLEPADGRVDLQGVGFPASFFMFSRPRPPQRWPLDAMRESGRQA